MKHHKLPIFILLICLTFQGKAQTTSLQELVNRKQFATVIAYVDQLTPADSADYSIMNAIAQAYEGMLKYRDAFNCYNHCLTMDTTNIDILNALARTATNLGKASDAESYFQKVLSTDSTNFYANYQLARLYYQLANYEKAAEKYEYLLMNDDTNSTLLRSVGDCYMKLESLGPAISAYSLAYQHNKENAGLASALINSLLRAGGPTVLEALSICDTALFYNPESRLLKQNKGMALYMNKKYADADTLYTQLLEEGDSTYFTLKYGGASRYYAGQFMRAVEPLESAYKKDTTSVDVCLLLGSSLGKTYDRKQAYALFDKAEEGMKPDEFLSNQLLLFRAETYQKDWRYNEASRLYYELWKKTEKLSVLANITNMYSEQNVSQYKDENIKQRGLFLNVLYVKEMLLSKKETKYLYFKRALLESFLEDMFFRSVKEETMLSPDGKKSKITADELRELANKLPEIPEDVKQYLEEAKKPLKKTQKKEES